MTIHFDCDLCGMDYGQPLPQNDDVVVCGNCGFIYVEDRRTAKEIADSWTNEIYPTGGYDPNWPGVKARLFYVAQWLDSKITLAGKSVLDIGAGRGLFLDYVRNLGAYPVGLEPSPDNCRRLRGRDIYCFTGTVEDFPQGIGQYDVVTILWTLENCQDLNAMLKFAKRACKQDGAVIVATGSRILVHPRKPLKDYFSKNEPDTHSFRFTLKSLYRALLKNGLHINNYNDFHQNDVLLVKAAHCEPMETSHYNDDPKGILEFFKLWEKMDEFLSKDHPVSGC